MTESLRTQIRLKNSKCKEYVKSNNVDIVESYDYDYDYEITLFEHKQNQHIHIIIVQ